MDADYSCTCVAGGWLLKTWASFTATIYINTEKLTPESWIESHERGHVDDYIKTTSWFVSKGGGTFGARYQCVREGERFKTEMFQRLALQRLRRDNFFARLACQ